MALPDRSMPSPETARLAGILGRSAGWMKFVAILAIVGGALTALTIVGIIYAWLPIWLGVLLYQAADRVQQAESTSDPAALEASLSKLALMFKIQGIATIASIAIAVLLTILFIGTILAAIRQGNLTSALGALAGVAG